jgi:hypothetical protein
LPQEFRCDNGHHFSKKVWKKVHFLEESGQRLFEVIDKMGDVRCPVPGCGARAVPVEG